LSVLKADPEPVKHLFFPNFFSLRGLSQTQFLNRPNQLGKKFFRRFPVGRIIPNSPKLSCDLSAKDPVPIP
jgi:hypothetical protein